MGSDASAGGVRKAPAAHGVHNGIPIGGARRWANEGVAPGYKSQVTAVPNLLVVLVQMLWAHPSPRVRVTSSVSAPEGAFPAECPAL